MGILIRILINALAIIVVGAIFPGILVHDLLTAIAAGFIIGVINAFVRPLLLILTLPFTVLTMGLFLFILNGFCFWLTAALVPGLQIEGFGYAVLGALFVSLISMFLNGFVHDDGSIVVISSERHRTNKLDD